MARYRQEGIQVEARRGFELVAIASTISMTALRGLNQFQNLQGGFGFAARPAYRWFERAQYPRCGQDRASMSRRSSGALGFKFAGLIVVLKYENIVVCRIPSNTSIRGYSLRSSRGPLTFLRITHGLQNFSWITARIFGFRIRVRSEAVSSSSGQEANPALGGRFIVFSSASVLWYCTHSSRSHSKPLSES